MLLADCGDEDCFLYLQTFGGGAGVSFGGYRFRGAVTLHAGGVYGRVEGRFTATPWKDRRGHRHGFELAAGPGRICDRSLRGRVPLRPEPEEAASAERGSPGSRLTVGQDGLRRGLSLRASIEHDERGHRPP